MPTLYNGIQFPCDGPDLQNIEKVDMGCMPMVHTMMGRGLQVDLTHFERMGKTLTEDMEQITEDVRQLAGYYVNLDSGDQVEHLLFHTLELKQAKEKYTRSKKRLSVEEEVLVAIQHDHEVIPKILDYKELSKLRGTYVNPMPKLARRTKHGVWRMFPNLGMTRVPSGRFNCKEPNMLAFPSRTKRGKEIRNGFITDPGWSYISIDFSQFEVRAAAHSSQDANLMAVYFNEEDVYSDFAISAFQLEDKRYKDESGWHYPGVDKETQRFPSKTCTLAGLYDVTPGGLSEQMPVICRHCRKPAQEHTCGQFESLWDEDACQALLNSFYQRYPGLLSDRRRHHGRARLFGYVWDEWGRLHHVAAVRSVHPWVVAAALREVGNFPYQGLNSGALKIVMAAVQDDLTAAHMMGDVCWPLLPIHDELVIEVRDDVRDEVAELVKWRMETMIPLRVPVKAEWNHGDTWGTCK